MREIKFRAMNFGKFWYYSDKEGLANFFYMLSPLNGDTPLLNKNTIGQFTGLRDKNGKEIWEGDVVRFCQKQGYWSHNRGDVEEVKYITDQQAQYCGFGFSALHPLTNRKAGKVEVIGNIYENPELLKSEEEAVGQ